jgi:hypothetical protein
MSGKTILLLIILILGPGVLVSYYIAGQSNPFGMDALWGNIPEKLKLVYPIGMLIATTGFFPFTYFCLFKSEQPAKYILGYLLILIPSILWLPLTVEYLKEPNSMTWIIIRVVLFAVAIGALLIYRQIAKERNVDSQTLLKWSKIGLMGFIFHTLVLDGLVWPYFF